MYNVHKAYSDMIEIQRDLAVYDFLFVHEFGVGAQLNGMDEKTEACV
jgi:hypothetical protein